MICIFLVSPAGSVGTTLFASSLSTSFGSSATVTCNAQGGPNNTFEWTNNQGQVVSNSAVLQFPSINGSDGGVYTCTATNAAGSGSETATIIGNIIYVVTHKLFKAIYTCVYISFI